MVAKTTKKTRQAKRAAARKAAKVNVVPTLKVPTINIDLALPEVEIIVQGLLELPGKYTLRLMEKLGRAQRAALVVKPKGKKK